MSSTGPPEGGASTPTPIPVPDPETEIPVMDGDSTSLLRDRLLAEGALADEADESARRVACARCGRPCRPDAVPEAPGLCVACAAAFDTEAVSGKEDLATEPALRLSAGLPAPDSRFGRYVIQRELGRGGMGIVFRALDPELRRAVALKILRLRDSAEMVERFLREARTAATLDHPGIVPIHEVNVHQGAPYFVMAFVEGRTLGEAIARGELAGTRERARLVLEAAEAVAHAHARRVIHRDLKPSNILIDADGRAHVVDFGLAKHLDEGTRLTSTGDLLGTPHYMSPEQLTGRVDQMGPATDVYALGVVLYEAVTGRPPFEGRTAAEVIANALARDPESPRARDARVPLDVETIVLKSLAKEPARRYPSAREFADDLARFLRGEAIAARPEGMPGRLWRWMRRRPALVGAAAVAALSVSLAAGSEWEAARQRAEQERVSAEFVDYLRGIASTNLDATLSLRRAGVGGDLAQKFLVRLEEAARLADKRAPALAEPAYHLGRMYRALQRFDDALREQERALARDPDFAPSLYERAVLDAHRYRARLAFLRAQWERSEGRRLAESGAIARAGLGAQSLPPAPSAVELAERDAVAADLRRRILADLERLERRLERVPGPAAPAGTSPGMLACARGLFLLHGGRPEERAEACRLLEEALARDPLLEEATEGIADARLEEGKFADAEAALTRGLEIDRGYLPFRLGRADTRFRRGMFESHTGRDPRVAFEGAVADFTLALAVAADSAVARLGRGRTLAVLADRLGDAGGDPEPMFVQAIEDLGAAVAVVEAPADAWRARGWARAALGYQRTDRGGDPRESYASALADFDEAVRRDPEFVEAFRERADLHRYWALYVKSVGEDPTPHYQAAMGDYARALALDPRDRLCWRRRGSVRFTWGNWRKSRGEDGDPMFVEAEADFAKALELAPDDPGVWADLGQLHLYRGGLRAESGGDPVPDYRAALDCYGRSLAVNAGASGTWHSRGSASLWWAERCLELGEDPEPHLAEAERDVARAQELAPGSYDVLTTRAGLLDVRAQARVRAGQDPGALLDEAIAVAGRAVEVNSRAAGAWMQRGVSRARWASWKASQGAEVAGEFAAARADLDRALGVTEGWDRIWLMRGRIGVDAGAAAAARGADPGDWFRAAAADLEGALRQNPRLPLTWCTRGELRRREAAWTAAHGGDPVPLRAAARDDLDRAVALAPAWAVAYAERARLRCDLGEADGARADVAEALRLAPLRTDYAGAAGAGK